MAAVDQVHPLWNRSHEFMTRCRDGTVSCVKPGAFELLRYARHQAKLPRGEEGKEVLGSRRKEPETHLIFCENPKFPEGGPAHHEDIPRPNDLVGISADVNPGALDWQDK